MTPAQHSHLRQLVFELSSDELKLLAEALEGTGLKGITLRLPPEKEQVKRNREFFELIETYEAGLSSLMQAMIRLGHYPRRASNIREQARPFVTRTPQLAELRKQLFATGADQVTRQPICGAPGIGKTEFARNYARSFKSDYAATFELRAATPDELTKGLRELLTAHVPPPRPLSGPDDDWIMLSRYLGSLSQPWLLILDGVRTPDDVPESFFPTQGTGHILLTTRAGDCREDRFATPVWLQELEQQEAEDFFLWSAGTARAKLTAASELAAVAAMVRKLCRHPLALRQIGREIARLKESFSKYQQTLETRFLEKLQRAASRDEVKVSIDVALNEVIRSVSAAHPGLSDLLRLCSLLAQAALPKELFIRCYAELGLDGLKNGSVSLNEWLAELEQVSLARAENDSFRIAAIVLETQYSQLGGASFQEFSQKAMGALVKLLSEPDSGSPELTAQLLPHAQALAYRMGQNATVPLTGAKMSTLTSDALHQHGQKEAAEELCNRSLRRQAGLLQELQSDYIEALIHQARRCQGPGKEREVERLCLRALPLLDAAAVCAAQATEHAAVEDTLQGWKQEVLSLLIQSTASRPRDCAGYCSKLAASLSRGGTGSDRTAALHFWKQAVVLRKGVLGWDHFEVATDLYNLSTALIDLERFREAEPFLRKALAVLERVHGATHPDVTPVLRSLASVLREPAQHEEAAQLLARADRLDQAAPTSSTDPLEPSLFGGEPLLP